MNLQETNQLPGRIQVVAFYLSANEYALEIEHVKEIIRLLNITRVPHAPYYIEGVINLRGSIIPVINLHKRIGLDSNPFSEQTRIIIISLGDIKAGIIVDKVCEVMYLDPAAIITENYYFNPINTKLIKGMSKIEKRLLVILDLEKMLETENPA